MKVMIADDEPQILATLEAAFESKGFEVLKYSDGQTALNNVATQQPDLIILDVLMPKLSGWDACHLIKSKAETKHIPVIILTAKTKDIDELMACEVAADAYIRKPFDPLEVLKKAEELIGGKK